jgi:hypothetical protein
MGRSQCSSAEHKQILDRDFVIDGERNLERPWRIWGKTEPGGSGENELELREKEEQSLAESCCLSQAHPPRSCSAVSTKRKGKGNYPRVGQRIRESGRDDTLSDSLSHTYTPL